MSNFLIVIIKTNKTQMNPNEPKWVFTFTENWDFCIFFAQKTTKKCLKLSETKGNKEKKEPKKRNY